MISFENVGAVVGAQMDRLAEVHGLSENVPATLGGFIRELTGSSCRAAIPPDALKDAYLAVGIVRGVAIAMGGELADLVEVIIRGEP